MVKEKSIQILLVKRWRERIPASIKAKLPAHAVAMDDEPTNTKEHFLTQNTCAIQTKRVRINGAKPKKS